MRIGIDIGDLSTGIVGVGSVIYQMITAIAQEKTTHEFFLYQKSSKKYVHAPQFRRRIYRSGPYEYWKEQIYFSARSVLDTLDIFHAPIHMPPAVVSSRTNIVMTVHDLHSELDTHNFYPAPMNRYFIPHRRAAIARAHGIIVHSRFVEEQVKALCPNMSAPIVRIPVGIKSEYFVEVPAVVREQVRQKYALPEKYILYVGSIEPWKRVPFLIKSVAQYRNQYNSDIALVIVGRPGWNDAECDTVRTACAEHAWVRWLGYIAQHDMPAVFQNARLFASASVWEGAGLIFLEALASGLPVVAANTAAIPETVGPGGILFDSEQTEAASDVFHQVLDNPDTYQQLQEQAREHIPQFSWTEYGKKVLALYELVVNGK